MQPNANSREHLTEAFLCDVLPTGSDMSSYDQKRTSERKCSVFCTSKILKLFVCVFYGILPQLFAEKRMKCLSFIIPLCFVLLQWYAIVGYAYCTDVFWVRSNAQGGSKNGTRISDDLPEIPIETLLLLLGLAVSGAITVSMAIYYFYSKNNDFSTSADNGFKLIPRIEFENQDDTDLINEVTELSNKEWLVTNCWFCFGMVNVIFVIATDFGTDTLFDFHGIREFLYKTTPSNRAIYIVAVTMLFWGFGCTVCACCIFHIMSRRIIMLIGHTKAVITDTAVTRKDFFNAHEKLLFYTEKMIDKFKYWFAIHNVMFIFLVAAMIFEWVTFMKTSKYEHNYILSQVAGTMLICYKFAFPFFSASRVTVEFKEFYLDIVRSNKIENIPELLLLPNFFGFSIFGLRITPSMAMLVFISSFLGIMKFISAELQR